MRSMRARHLVVVDDEYTQSGQHGHIFNLNNVHKGGRQASAFNRRSWRAPSLASRQHRSSRRPDWLDMQQLPRATFVRCCGAGIYEWPQACRNSRLYSTSKNNSESPTAIAWIGSVALMNEKKNFAEMARRLSNWTEHSCQRKKLVGERHRIGSADCELRPQRGRIDYGQRAVLAARFRVSSTTQVKLTSNPNSSVGRLSWRSL
jgi:hypothetical protein